ncbi:MAG: hypothetical protein K2M46_11175, partial [Lachnospiraceae bacterium]|nr:hypothetical protein [Lachnospiraceae bacterium]
MSENLLILSIPKFKVDFLKNSGYRYRVEEEKNELKKQLAKGSNGYCMYCYRRIVLDGQNFGHLEHAIEKSNSNKLIDCVPNIAIACSVCNTSYKKRGEKQRKLSKKVIVDFENNLCDENCVKPCSAYLKLREEYVKKEHAHIILQPLGVKGNDSKEELEIEYNILDGEFKPSQNHRYTDKERQFIQNHIDRFQLNEKGIKTKQLLKFLKDTINNGGRYTTMEYNHM